MVDFGYDFLDSSRISSVTQHVQNGVYVITRNLTFFLCVKGIESFSQNFAIKKNRMKITDNIKNATKSTQINILTF